MADRVIYGAGSEDEETEADRRRRGSRTREDEFVEDRYGDVTEPNPRSDEEYRDAAGRDYGYGGSAEYASGYGGGGYGEGDASGDYYGRYGSASDEMSDMDSWMAGIPLLGDLTGANSRAAAVAAERERRMREGRLAELAEFMPNANDLMVNYRHEGEIGPGEDSLMARDAFREWSEGGLTDADRAMMEESRRSSGRAARADREANLSALEARGMGGSGASLAAMLSAGEGAADQNAATDATMMGAAQQRQMAATNALGEFGAREDDYARGREGRNTTYDHSTAESVANARQQAHENRQAHTAMALNMSPYGAGSAGGHAADEEDEADAAAGGFFSGLASMFS